MANTQAVVVQGIYGYIGVGRWLIVVDVCNPVNPKATGQTPVLPDAVQDVHLAGDHVYTAAGEAGLRVVDVSDPSAPVEVGAHDMPGMCCGEVTYLARTSNRRGDSTSPRASGGRVAALLTLGLLLLLALAPQVRADPAQIGEWGPVLDWGVQAKHMILLPTGDVLVWSTGENARVWDSSTDASFTPTPFFAGDLHCAGQATLADGRIIVVGGQGASPHIGIRVTGLFNPFTNAWTEGALMNHARWYGTATALPDGRILASAGDDENKDRVTIPEIYDPVADTWTPLTGANREQSIYAYMFVLPDGRAYEAGAKTRTWFLDTDGAGSWTEGPTNSFGSSGYAESAAMYEPGKILRAGGGKPAFANAAVIDTTVASPAWWDISPMMFPRRRHDLTILADGSVLAVGGTGKNDNEAEAVLEAELWDPGTEQWTVIPRRAHNPRPSR